MTLFLTAKRLDRLFPRITAVVDVSVLGEGEV